MNHSQPALKRVTLSPSPNPDGTFLLTAPQGQEVPQGCAYPTRADALRAARLLWPADSPWHGKPVRGGWSIVVGE